MRARVPRFLIALLFVAALPSHAWSQNICSVQDTRQACVEKYVQRLPEQLAATQKQARTVAAGANTGGANATSAVPTSSFTDFFNTLQVAADTGSQDPDAEALAFELNHCGVPVLPGRSVSCQLRARLEKPELHQSLNEALREAGLGDQVATIEDGFDITDRTVIGVFVSPLSNRWGRELNAESNALFQILMDEAYKARDGELEELRKRAGEANATYAERYLQALAQSDSRVMQMFKNNTLLAETFTFDKLPPDLQQEAVTQFETVAAATVKYASARAVALQQVSYFELANLMNNQPQLYAGVEYGSAADLVGPDEVRAKIAYETGFANINNFKKYLKNSCAADGDQSKAECLRRYLADPGVKSALSSGSRLAVTLEYIRRKRFSASIPDTAVSFSAPASRSWLGSLTYGWYLDPLDNDSQTTRVDVVASYEDVTDDPSRQNRGIASAVLARQLSNDWVLNFGVVYATKPEFRAEADKDLSLRLGINYKLLRKPQQ